MDILFSRCRMVSDLINDVFGFSQGCEKNAKCGFILSDGIRPNGHRFLFSHGTFCTFNHTDIQKKARHEISLMSGKIKYVLGD